MPSTKARLAPYIIGAVLAGAFASSSFLPSFSHEGDVVSVAEPTTQRHALTPESIGPESIDGPQVFSAHSEDVQDGQTSAKLDLPKEEPKSDSSASADAKSVKAVAAKAQAGGNEVKLTQDYLRFDTTGLSPDQVQMVTLAAKASKQHIPAAFFRAVGEQESGLSLKCFTGDRNGGTDGIYQLNRYEMNKYYEGGDLSTDRNNNGTPDVQELEIHTKVAAAYFDDLYVQVKQMRAQNPDAAWAKGMSPLENLAIAHNAGTGGMQEYPNFHSNITKGYLNNMRTKIPLYSFGAIKGTSLTQ